MEPFSRALAAVLFVAAANAQIACPQNQLSATFSLSTVTSGVPVFDSSCSILTKLEINTVLPTLPADTLDPLTNLEELAIEDSLQALPAGFFDATTALVDLSLQSNSLTELPSGLFDLTTALTLINLGVNSLSRLPSGLLDFTTALTALALASNTDLSELPFDLFDNTPALQVVIFGNNPSLQCTPPSAGNTIFLNKAVCSAPPPSPPSQPAMHAQALSDPHFRGFGGQTFDVLGRVGSIYSLIEDSAFTLRAKFVRAYDSRDFQPFLVEQQETVSKTWISQVGLSLPVDIAICIGVLDADDDGLARCSPDTPSCFASGAVKVNGEQLSSVGETVLQEGSANDSRGVVTLALENSKSFGRVIVNSPPLTLQADVVLPKKEWQIPQADWGMYSHISLNFVSVQLTPDASGILGITQADDFSFENGDEDRFEVDSLF